MILFYCKVDWVEKWAQQFLQCFWEECKWRKLWRHIQRVIQHTSYGNTIMHRRHVYSHGDRSVAVTVQFEQVNSTHVLYIMGKKKLLETAQIERLTRHIFNNRDYYTTTSADRLKNPFSDQKSVRLGMPPGKPSTTMLNQVWFQNVISRQFCYWNSSLHSSTLSPSCSFWFFSFPWDVWLFERFWCNSTNILKNRVVFSP